MLLGWDPWKRTRLFQVPMNDRIEVTVHTAGGLSFRLKLRSRQDALSALDKLFGKHMINLTDCTGLSTACGEHASQTGCRIAQAVCAILLFVRREAFFRRFSRR
jgi:hypothetical protein